MVTHLTQRYKSKLKEVANTIMSVEISLRLRASEQVPAVRPRNVRKRTVTSGNQEDRGREQLDQVSPRCTDSFFPFVRLSPRKESVSTVSVCFQHLNLFDNLGREDAIRRTREASSAVGC